MDPYEKYLLKAIHFLKFRPRSEKEVRDKLKEKKAPDEIIERVILYLKDQKYLNDTEFARMWVRSRLNFNPKSKRILILELRKKGITQEIIEEVIADPGEEQEVNDVAQAKKLAEQKLPKLASLPFFEKRQKISAFLGRRGFDWDTIKEVINGLVKENG